MQTYYMYIEEEIRNNKTRVYPSIEPEDAK